MRARLLWRSSWGRKSRVVSACAAVAVAATVASALLNVALGIGEKVAAELRAFGANVVVVPKDDAIDVEIGGLRYHAAADAAYLAEDDLPKLKGIFWGHNIVGLAPFLSAPVNVDGTRALLVGTWFEREVAPALRRDDGGSEETQFRAGVKAIAPWWRVDGHWVEDTATEAMLGGALAARLGVAIGERLSVAAAGGSRDFHVVGIVHTGGTEEDQVFVDLAAAQSLLRLPGRADRVQVSVLVKPDDALAVRARRNPQSLSPDEYERWYCSPYLDTVLHQIEEAIPNARARALRDVADAEGGILGRLTLTMLLVTAIAVVTASLGVMATLTATIVERRSEIGLMKALGAAPRQIVRQLLVEAVWYGIVGGIVGAGAGSGVARLIGVQVFRTAITTSPVTVPFVVAFGVVVALIGAALPSRQAARLDPIRTLRGR